MVPHVYGLCGTMCPRIMWYLQFKKNTHKDLFSFFLRRHGNTCVVVSITFNLLCSSMIQLKNKCLTQRGLGKGGRHTRNSSGGKG